jgi:hypothetical protein
MDSEPAEPGTFYDLYKQVAGDMLKALAASEPTEPRVLRIRPQPIQTPPRPRDAARYRMHEDFHL